MRYENTPILKDTAGKRYFKEVLYPQIDPKETDIYVITTAGDRLDLLADQFYGDSTKYWIISCSNNIKKDRITIAVGTQLRIPTEVDEFLKKFAELNNNR
jgi:hypothetical protein